MRAVLQMPSEAPIIVCISRWAPEYALVHSGSPEELVQAEMWIGRRLRAEPCGQELGDIEGGCHHKYSGGAVMSGRHPFGNVLLTGRVYFLPMFDLACCTAFLLS